jgi:hypothetical protein
MQIEWTKRINELCEKEYYNIFQVRGKDESSNQTLKDVSFFVAVKTGTVMMNK